MHTPESKRDALLDDLKLGADLLDACADMPVEDLDITFVPLDLPDPAEVAAPAPPREQGAPSAATSPAATGSSKSERITIRVPRAVLEGFKTRAAGRGVGYQTLIVRALREWLSAARPA